LCSPCIFQQYKMLHLTNVFLKVNGWGTVLSEQLIQSQLFDHFLFFRTYIFIPVYKTASHVSIYSSRWTQSILSHSILKYILIWFCHLRLGLLIILSSYFHSLLSEQYLQSATTTSFPIFSYCIRVVASCQHCITCSGVLSVLHYM